MSAIDGPRLLKYVAKLLLYVYKKKKRSGCLKLQMKCADRQRGKNERSSDRKKNNLKKKMVGDKEQL